MPRTPKRAGRAAKPGSQFLTEVVANNLRAGRLLRRMSQDALAQAMRDLGHQTWSRATVSEIERHGRTVSIDEMVSVAVLLRLPPNRLMDPFLLPAGAEKWLAGIDFGGPTAIPAELVEPWTRGELTIGLQPDGGLWLEGHTPEAEEAAQAAIRGQKEAIKRLEVKPEQEP